MSGEVHSGFANLRSGLPMNIQAHHPGFPVWAGAQADIDRIETVWNECLAASGGPYLFGETRTVADAMYAPDCTRLQTYDVKVGAVASEYVETILAMPEMVEWMRGGAPRASTTSRNSRWSSDRRVRAPPTSLVGQYEVAHDRVDLPLPAAAAEDPVVADAGLQVVTFLAPA